MMNYWGFDLGDGESTLARVGSGGVSYPERLGRHAQR